jgi:hypothetical protein
MNRIDAYDSFEIVSNKQVFENIKIEINFPFSDVIFDDIDFELACEVVAIKFLGGFNDNYESVTIFLNAIKIENSELYIWYDNLLINFVKKYRNIIVDKNNVFVIKLKTDDQLSYITQIKLELKK